VTLWTGLKIPLADDVVKMLQERACVEVDALLTSPVPLPFNGASPVPQQDLEPPRDTTISRQQLPSGHCCINLSSLVTGGHQGAVLLSIFKRPRFPVEIILLCVRWYCKYGISYRDLAEMMQERASTWTHPRSSAECSVMPRKLISGSADIKAIARAHGAWTILMCGSAGDRNTFSAPSTSTGD
jgi:hypothetical protein